MIDFLFPLSGTVFVTILMFTINWLVSRLPRTNNILAVQRLVEQTLPQPQQQVFLEEAEKSLLRQEARRRAVLAWGVDLAATAFSLDLALLWLWSTNSTSLPFFSRWDAISASMQPMIWTWLLTTHSVFFIMSIFLRNLHAEKIESAKAQRRRSWDMEGDSKQAYRKALHQSLKQHYNEEELRTVFFNLNIDYDDLDGKGRTAKARELIYFLERHNRLTELHEEIASQHPDAPLTKVPKGRLGKLLASEWITQNGWSVASNSIGFFSLLSSLVVATNAI